MLVATVDFGPHSCAASRSLWQTLSRARVYVVVALPTRKESPAARGGVPISGAALPLPFP